MGLPAQPRLFEIRLLSTAKKVVNTVCNTIHVKDLLNYDWFLNCDVCTVFMVTFVASIVF